MNCKPEELTMTAKKTLRNILEAADPADCEDAAIRESLCVALGVLFAKRPLVAEPTADDSIGLPGFSALTSDRRFSRSSQDCLLSVLS
jgi:hypothetical protein